MEIILEVYTKVAILSLIIGLVATLRSFYGYFSHADHVAFDKILSLVFVISLSVLVVTICLLFFFKSFSYEESFKFIEDAALTIFATISAISGHSISTRSMDAVVQFRFRGIFHGLASGLLLYAYFITSSILN